MLVLLSKFPSLKKLVPFFDEFNLDASGIAMSKIVLLAEKQSGLC
jgi:hypothetical protein